MRRSNVLKLRQERWVAVQGADGLEVCVIPSAATNLHTFRDGLPTDQDKHLLCSSCFVNFRGYEDDDGKPIENSLRARLELIDLDAVFLTIQYAALKAQGELVQGESDAASD